MLSPALTALNHIHQNCCCMSSHLNQFVLETWHNLISSVRIVEHINKVIIVERIQYVTDCPSGNCVSIASHRSRVVHQYDNVLGAGRRFYVPESVTTVEQVYFLFPLHGYINTNSNQ